MVKFLMTNTSKETIDGLNVPYGSFHLSFSPGGVPVAGHRGDRDEVQINDLKPKGPQEFEVLFPLPWEQFKTATANTSFDCYVIEVDAVGEITNASWARPLNHGLSGPPAC